MSKRAAIVCVVALAAAVPWPAAAAGDRTKPTVRFTTSNGAVVLGSPVTADPLPTSVAGTASDAGGIATVSVWAIPCNLQASDEACAYVGPYTEWHRHGGVTLTCSTSKRTACTWSARAPLAPGWYWVAAEARDRAGNRGTTGIIRVLVA